MCAVIVFGASLVYFPAVAIIAAADDGLPLPLHGALVAIDVYLFGVACFILFTARGRARLRRAPRTPGDRRTVRRLWWFYGVVCAAFLLTNVPASSDKKLSFVVVLPVVVFIVSTGGQLILLTDSTRGRGAATNKPGMVGPHGDAS